MIDRRAPRLSAAPVPRRAQKRAPAAQAASDPSDMRMPENPRPRATMSSASPPRPDAPISHPDPVLEAIRHVIAGDRLIIPPMPAVLARLSDEVAKPSLDVHGIAQLVGTDQALAAHVLRCASHTLPGAREQIASLTDAIVRLGAGGLYSLVVSFSLGRESARLTPLQSLRRDVLRRAAALAVFCRRLAPRRGVDPEGAFLCGLLGSFGLSVSLGAIEQALADHQLEESRPADAWMDVARRCEQQIAAHVAEEWGVPQLVADVAAARRGGAPLAAPSPLAHLAPFVDLLAAGDALTELFYRDAAPAVEDIALAIGCDAEEAAEIAQLLPEAAAAVWALGAEADDLRVTHSIQIPVVEPPPTTLRGSLVEVSIPLVVERNSGDQHLVCVALAADGFVAHGTQALPHNQVVKCRLLAGAVLDLVAFVSSVVKESGYRFEFKPIGLTGGNARKWRQLRGEDGEPAASPGPGDQPPRARSPRPSGLVDPAAARQGGVSLHPDRGPLRRLGSWLRGRGDS
ncbi:MAG TPA: HDOD domain-containing protein [Kofleriaceae bacterium]|nr:HDOD domain-containing protein [Kofleriaceae bacterium]